MHSNCFRSLYFFFIGSLFSLEAQKGHEHVGRDLYIIQKCMNGTFDTKFKN